MDLEREVARLRKNVKSLWALMGLGVLATGGWFVFSKTVGSYWGLSVERKGNAVSLSTMSDGPFIVTHLTVRGWDAESEADKRTAALDPPLTIIDSAGSYVPDIRNLKWTDIRGDPTDPPGPETKITALYFRPEWAEPRDP